jgi:putative membrane protein
MWLQTGAYHLGGLAWLIAAIVIFIIAIIALIVAGRAMAQARTARRAGGAYARSMGGPGAPGTGSEAAKPPESFRMLDERYAKGEISREEYMQRQADLQSKS